MAKSVKTVYADALFSLAEEKGETDSLMEEIRAMRVVLAENEQFCKVMIHPQIAKTEKLELLSSVFEGRVSGTMLGFLQLLTEKNHFSEVSAVFEEYEACWHKKHNIGIAHVTSAMELTDAQKQKIHERLQKTTSYASVEEQYAVDPSLIGGIIVRIGDRVADGSIKHKLERLTTELNGIRLANE